MRPSPSFIVFEGLDGVGKTTLVQRLHCLLSEKGMAAMWTSEPYLNKNARTTQEYIDDRQLHVDRCIKTILNDPEKIATHLLCDRYTLSTAAYQSVDYADALRILDLQRDFPVPNLTILLTASIDTLEKRLYAREKDGIPKRGFDSASRAFKERVQTTYIHLAQDYPNVHIFNAEQPLETLAESILTLILSLSEKAPPTEGISDQTQEIQVVKEGEEVFCEKCGKPIHFLYDLHENKKYNLACSPAF